MEVRAVGRDAVVVGVSERAASMAAARWAVQAAAMRKADLVLAHGYVITPQVSLLAEATSLYAEAADVVVADTFRHLVIPPRLTVRRIVKPLPPVSLLRGLSTEAQLIVLGIDDLTTFRRITDGATTARVCATAACPVVVVPPYITFTKRLPVMVAVDGSTGAEPALRLAFDEAALRKVPLIVLNCAPDTETPFEHHERLLNVEEILAGWRTKRPEVSIRVELVTGDPAAQITDHTAHAALMVVGRPHRRHVLAWSQTVASAVLDHCHCALAVVPGTPLPEHGRRPASAAAGAR